MLLYRYRTTLRPASQLNLARLGYLPGTDRPAESARYDHGSFCTDHRLSGFECSQLDLQFLGEEQDESDLPVSFKVEVLAYGEANFASNGLRFATREEAEGYRADLFSRWMGAKETRIAESADPVNYEFMNGRARRLEAQNA